MISYPIRLNIDQINNANIENSPENLELKKIKYNIRMNFAKKVYSIVISQLILTFMINCLSFFEEVKIYFKENYTILGIGILLLISVLIFINIKKNISKEVPYNYYLLILYTLSISLILLFLSSQFSPEKILIIWSSLIFVCFSIIVISFYLKEKFKILFAILIVLVIISIFLGILIFFLKVIFNNPNVSILFTVITSVGSVIFGIYLIFHTKILVIDKIEVDTDTYIIASMQIYSDVILIFITIICSVKE
jgi:FtsH-binding integral membrane protein